MTQERYSHGYDASVLNSYRSRSVANSAAYLLPYLQDGMRVLDLGCGPGSISADLAALLPQGQVVGVDISEVSVASAQQAYRRDNLQFQTANVYALPFQDACFDVVHAHQVLQHLGQPDVALREMVRVLKPNGIVAVRDTAYDSMAWQPAVPELARWMDVYQAIAKRNGGNPNIGPDLAGLCVAAGLAEVVVSQSDWHYHQGDGSAQWWGGVWAGRMLQSDFAHQAQEYGLADWVELNHISQAWQGWGQLPDADFVMHHHQVVACRSPTGLSVL